MIYMIVSEEWNFVGGGWWGVSDCIHAEDPRCSFCTRDGGILRFLDETVRMLVGFGELAVKDLVEHGFAVLALAVGLLDAVDIT